MVRLIKLTLVLFCALALHSCDENFTLILNVDCSQCVRVEPKETTATFEFSSGYEKIVFTLYEGFYTEGNVYYSDTLTVDYFEKKLPVETYYTATAEYIIEGEKRIVVDGENIEKKLATSECQIDCWVILGGNFDLTYIY